jgi:tripartite-type tricarboxylate transporter receptor subunit TctC
MRRLLLALALMAPSLPTTAQEAAWPDRPVRLIVPSGPGGAFDIIGRVIADGLNGPLGNRMVVDNRAGAGGVIAAEAAARAAPDGTSFLLGILSTQVVIPATQRVGYDPITAFTPVAQTTMAPMVLAVHPGLQVRSVAEFIALTKAQPGTINAAYAGRASLPHLLLGLFMRQTGAQPYPVPFSLSAQGLQALMSGQVGASFETASIIRPQAGAGTLRALAVTSATRDPSMPDIPTMAEAGVPDFVAGSWTGIFAPAGTPPAVVARLNTLLNELAHDPAYRTRLANIGVQAQTGSAEDLGRWVTAERARWSDLARGMAGAD